MPQENSVYVSFQRLVWTSFLSVISFQLIAPTVWGYLSKFLSLSYHQGYNAFVLVYGSILPLLIIIWLTYYKHELRSCLFPFDKEDEMNLLCLWFIRGLVASSVFQIVQGMYFLLKPNTSIDIYVGVQVANLILCILLLSIGIYVSYQRVSIYLNTRYPTDAKVEGKLGEGYRSTLVDTNSESRNQLPTGDPAELRSQKAPDTSSSITSLTEFEESREKWQRRILRSQYIRLLSTCLAFFILFAFVGGWYLINYTNSIQENEVEKKELNKVPNGFRLLEFNNEIKKSNLALGRRMAIHDLIQKEDSLAAIAGKKTQRSNYIHSAEILQLIESGKSLSSLSSASDLKEKSLEIAKNQWLSVVSQLSADTVKELASLPTIYHYASQVEGNVNSAAKANLGAHLRSSQLTIMMILLFFLSCLLSIFVFLQIDHIIKTAELKKAQENKRLTNGPENDLIEKERHHATTSKMMEGIWLHITIAVWLLVPLFKPVEDAKIDAESPFKMITLSRPDSPIGPIEHRYEYHYVPLVVDIKMDSPKDTTVNLEIKKLLKELKDVTGKTYEKVKIIQPD